MKTLVKRGKPAWTPKTSGAISEWGIWETSACLRDNLWRILEGISEGAISKEFLWNFEPIPNRICERISGGIFAKKLYLPEGIST